MLQGIVLAIIMRQKSDIEGKGEFRCCLCCHVRTGSIILGIWHLVLHVFALGILASIVFHPDLMCQKLAQWKTSDIHTNELGTSIHGVVLKPNPNSQFPELPELSAGPAGDYAFLREWKWDLKDVHVAMAVTLCTGLITSLMVYGAVRGCPSCLMPFFCLQVFDFMISALSVIGYFSYMPNPREIIQNSHDIPFQKELMQLDAQWLCAIVMAAFIVCMLVKAYFMGVVWSCYKYLKLLQMTQIVDNYLDLEEEMLLPTDSEMGVKSPLYLSPYGHPPPPPYTPPTNNEV